MATDASNAATGPLNVYVAGKVTGSNGHTVAVFWKNGVQTNLSPTSLYENFATAMYIYGTDRYVVGFSDQGVILTSPQEATQWKNEVQTYYQYGLLTGIYVDKSGAFICGNGCV